MRRLSLVACKSAAQRTRCAHCTRVPSTCRVATPTGIAPFPRCNAQRTYTYYVQHRRASLLFTAATSLRRSSSSTPHWGTGTACTLSRCRFVLGTAADRGGEDEDEDTVEPMRGRPTALILDYVEHGRVAKDVGSPSWSVLGV